MYKKTLFLLSLCLLVGCPSGNNPAGTPPNKGNLPNLANAPIKQQEQIKKIKITGRVTDIYTNKPIENATIFIHVYSDILSSPSPSPLSITSPSPFASPKTTTPSPQTTVSPQKTASPTPTQSPTTIQQENEEEVENNLQQIIFPDINKATEYWTKTNKDGKFWKDGVIQGPLSITIVAPKYQGLTITNPNLDNLDITLKPEQNTNKVKVAGMVTSINNQPISEAIVSASFKNLEDINLSTFTNGYGEFILDNVNLGKRSFVAFTQDNNGKIKSFGLLTNVILEKDKLQKGNEDLKFTPKVKSTPDNKEKVKNLEKRIEQILQRKSSKEENEEENSSVFKNFESLNPFNKKAKENKIYPIVVLKSVSRYIKVSGEFIDLPKGWEVKDIKVFLVIENSKDNLEEVYLNNFTLNYSKNKNFYLELPVPPDKLSYHLQFYATNNKGAISYHNEWDINKDSNLKLKFLLPPKTVQLLKINDNVPQTPFVGWDVSNEANIYNVTLQSGEGENTQIVWEGWTNLNWLGYLVKFGTNVLVPKKPYKFIVSSIKSNKIKSSNLDYTRLNSYAWNDIAIISSEQFYINKDKK